MNALRSNNTVPQPQARPSRRGSLNAARWNQSILRALCLLLAAVLLLSSCAGGEPQEELREATETTTEFQPPTGAIAVPYTKLDALNPFFMESLVNASLVSLLYDPLFTLDGGFMPQPLIAKDFTANGAALDVRLRDTLTFSDGSPLSAADVVYSFEKAKEAPLYRESLKNFTACAEQSGYAVQFTLETPDVNAVNLLTFPIVKAGTAEAPETPPTGAGRYSYQVEDGRPLLRCNLRYGPVTPMIGSVRLREVTESATLMHILNVGGIDCFYTDLSDGVAKRSYAGSNEVYLNELVFLGVNHYGVYLKNAEFRRALSLALSRSAIVGNAFVNHARAAFTPFNTSWEVLSAYQTAETPDGDPNGADALLGKVGAGMGRNPVFLRLLVNEEADAFLKSAANLIVEELSYVNITVELTEKPAAEYRAALQSGDFDLYLGDIRLTKNMDLSPFFTPDGAASWGINLEGSDLPALWADYQSGAKELDVFLNRFNELMPFIPLVYRNGQFCYSRVIRSAIQSTEDRLYYNIEEWLV